MIRLLDKKLKLAMFGLLLLGCTHQVDAEATPVAPLDAELRISAEFTTEERAEIDAAVSEWYEATGGSVRFGIVPSPGQEPWRIERRSAPSCGIHETWMGCARLPERQIDLNVWGIYPVDEVTFDLAAWGELRRTTLHEFGHALGLDNDVSPLMEQSTGTGQCIDATTLELVCEMRGCAERRPTCP